jgi:hypothetical protein
MLYLVHLRFDVDLVVNLVVLELAALILRENMMSSSSYVLPLHSGRRKYAQMVHKRQRPAAKKPDLPFQLPSVGLRMYGATQKLMMLKTLYAFLPKAILFERKRVDEVSPTIMKATGPIVSSYAQNQIKNMAAET